MTPRLPSCFLRVMKALLSLLLILSSTSALAVVGTVSGYITREQEKAYYLPENGGPRKLVRATRQETVESLKKMSARDFIEGQGEIVGDELLLQSIDFVGLRRLLGVWSAEKSLVNFRDYSQVTIYHSFLETGAVKSSFQYSIAPTSGNSWKIFFTDSSSIKAGSLFLDEGKATLKLYDVNSGSVVQTVELKRLYP